MEIQVQAWFHIEWHHDKKGKDLLLEIMKHVSREFMMVPESIKIDDGYGPVTSLSPKDEHVQSELDICFTFEVQGDFQVDYEQGQEYLVLDSFVRLFEERFEVRVKEYKVLGWENTDPDDVF